MMWLIAISTLLAASAPADGAPPPDRQQIEAAAARCGLAANSLRPGRDAYGDYADVSADGVLDRLDPKAFVCLIGWAEQTGARVGFVSEPPPGTQILAQGPIEIIRRAANAARACGLPVHVDPLSPDKAALEARRDSAPRPLACTRSWIEKQRDIHVEAGQ